MDSYVGRRPPQPNDTPPSPLSTAPSSSSPTNERAVPQTNTTPPSNMPALRSQGEFFMTGIVPAGLQPEESDCSICAEHLAEDVVRIARPCGHMFHAVCLLTWLQGDGRRNRTCPNCRCELYAAPVPQPSMNLAPPSRTREAIMEQRIQVQYETLRRAREDQMNNLRVIENNLRSTQIALGREPTAERTPIPAQPVNFNHRPFPLSDTSEASGRSRRRTHAENLGRRTEGTNIAHWRRQTAQEREDEEARAALDMLPPGSDRVDFWSVGTPDTTRRSRVEDVLEAEDRNITRRPRQVVERDAEGVETVVGTWPPHRSLHGEPVASSNQTTASGRAEERARLQSRHDLAVAEMRQLEAARLQHGLLHDSDEAAALERNLADLNRIRRDSRQQLQQLDRRAAEEDRSSDDSSPSIRTRRRRRMSARRAAGEDSSSDVPSIRMTHTHQAMANIRAAEETSSSNDLNPSSGVAGVNAMLYLSRVRAARLEEENRALMEAASRGQTSQTPESSATNNISPRPTQSAARGPIIGRTTYPAPRQNTTELIAPARDIAPSRLARARRVALLAGRGDDVLEEEIAEYYGFPGLNQLHDEPAFARMSNLARMRVRAQAAAELATVDMMNEQDDEIRNLFWPGRQANDNN